MVKKNFTLLPTVTTVILCLIIVLTGTHGSFYCQVKTSEGLQQCSQYGITETQESICKGSVFMIHAKIQEGNVALMCPWSSATIIVLVLGSLAALIYTISTILQRNQRNFTSGRSLLIVGLASLGVLMLTAILMLSDIVSGLNKCSLFEKALGTSDTTCTTSIFDITLMFAIISLGLVGYEIFLGYSRYKNEETVIETEGVYVPTMDYKKGYFQEYED